MRVRTTPAAIGAMLRPRTGTVVGFPRHHFKGSTTGRDELVRIHVDGTDQPQNYHMTFWEPADA